MSDLRITPRETHGSGEAFDQFVKDSAEWFHAQKDGPFRMVVKLSPGFASAVGDAKGWRGLHETHTFNVEPR